MGVDVYTFESLLSELYYNTICRFNNFFERICKHTWPAQVKSTRYLLLLLLLIFVVTCMM